MAVLGLALASGGFAAGAAWADSAEEVNRPALRDRVSDAEHDRLVSACAADSSATGCLQIVAALVEDAERHDCGYVELTTALPIIIRMAEARAGAERFHIEASEEGVGHCFTRSDGL